MVTQNPFAGLPPVQLATTYSGEFPQDIPVAVQLKYDGVRIRLAIEKDGVHAQTRNGRDLSRKLAILGRGTNTIPFGTVLDGELIPSSPAYRRSESADLRVQQRGHLVGVLNSNTGPNWGYEYVAFDVLKIRGRDITREPLRIRLDALLGCGLHADNPKRYNAYNLIRIAHTTHLPPGASVPRPAPYEEGLVVKDLSSPYTGGRRSTWIKWKPHYEQ